MTHSPKNQKMNENEVESIENAVKDAELGQFIQKRWKHLPMSLLIG